MLCVFTIRVCSIYNPLYLLVCEAAVFGLKFKNLLSQTEGFSLLVGMAGFEPTTSSTPCWRDTGLRYIPKRKPKIKHL